METMQQRFPRFVPKMELPDDAVAEPLPSSADVDEEAAAVERHEREVERCKLRLVHYGTQLELAEKRLVEAKECLARLRSLASRQSTVPASVESRFEPQPLVRMELKRPRPSALPTWVPVASPLAEEGSEPELMVAVGCSSEPMSAGITSVKSRSAVDRSNMEARTGKIDSSQRHQELIPSIKSGMGVNKLRFAPAAMVPSNHKRRLRCLELCPTDDSIFITSALDGLLNQWKVQPTGASASLLSTAVCLSENQGRPEAVAWHPDGQRVFSSYSAAGDQSQISVLCMEASDKDKLTFLEDKPHMFGTINDISFMPWSQVCFVTVGNDHAVVLWQERDCLWKSNKLHTTLHSSRVTGVCGFQNRQTILTVGEDKRIIGFDVSNGVCEFKHQIDSKCLGVLPNPLDLDLYMVHTGAHGKQLRLFDVRLNPNEVHSFGWQQESSKTQSGLISQSWSPDGWYITSGSMDPMIHIFDIRYDCQVPLQSIKAHNKRVFKAVWHQSAPLLISISSDYNIGIHKIS